MLKLEVLRAVNYLKIALCLSVLLLPGSLVQAAPSFLQQIAEVSEEWSQSKAEAEAAEAYFEKNLYLYSSGGLVCSPRANTQPTKEVLAKFKWRSLGCGCVRSSRSIAESRYAVYFNNAMLKLIESE